MQECINTFKTAKRFKAQTAEEVPTMKGPYFILFPGSKEYRFGLIIDKYQ
jgi:hypothetical protein